MSRSPQSIFIAAVASVLVSASGPAIAGECLDGQIPTQLVGPIDPVEYPDPVCVKCKVIVTKPAKGAEDTGTVSITYYYDDHPWFHGYAELVLVTSTARHVVSLSDVDLVEGETLDLEIEAGSAWSWSEVEYAWLELVPSE